jgi:hypothetical protein
VGAVSVLVSVLVSVVCVSMLAGKAACRNCLQEQYVEFVVRLGGR